MLTENRIKAIIRNCINEVVNGNVRNFTPYTPDERERNFSGIGKMGNPTYNEFKKWREDGLKNGIPSRELGWEAYLKTIT